MRWRGEITAGSAAGRTVRVARVSATAGFAAAVALAGGLGLAGRADAQEKPAAPAASAGAAAGGGAAAAGSEFDRLVAGAKAADGLLRVYAKDDHLFAEMGPGALDRPMILPIAISRGTGGMFIGGMTLNFDDDWVLEFRKVSDKIHVVRKNAKFRAKPGTPTAHAVERAYADSPLAALRVVTTSPRGAPVVDLADIFLSDLAGIAPPGYFLDRGLSTFKSVKSFPENVEVDVQLVFRAQRGLPLETLADDRSISVGLHYGLSPLPAGGDFRPRAADDRVGYFLTVVKDFTRDAGETSFVRYANRWKLEKADPFAKLSVPKKPIRFWVERSVPFEYRKYVREGILEWNKAFEKIGFLDAIEVRQQDDKDDFDPEDIRYNTIRWITADAGFAIGPSRVNPYTGEILDADILFDASMVRFEREEYAILSSDPAKLLGYDENGNSVEEDDAPADMHPKLREALKAARQRGTAHGSRCSCGMAHGMKRELMLGLAALEARGDWKPGQPVPIEFIGQSIKHTVMHEVGHTLGLRHNFKASSIISLDDLNDPKNAGKPTVGSVMDYIPVNVAPKGKPQGDFFPATIGPYDEWAIAWAYSENEADIKAIAAKAGRPELAYATDEDTGRPDNDPASNRWDLGDDPLKFGERRIALVKQLLENLPDRVTAAGEGFQPVRTAFARLLAYQSLNANFAAKLVGGVSVHRAHKGDEGGRLPLAVIPAARQREALKYLRENVFADRNYAFPPDLVARLAPSRWSHWGWSASGGDLVFDLHNRVLNIQRAALAQLFSPANLRRLAEAEALVAADADAVTLAEVFRTVTDGVWADAFAEVSDRPYTDRKPLVSSFRRSLQREHVRVLVMMLTAALPGLPPDTASLARLQMRRILALIDEELPGKLKAAGRKNKEVDDVSAAHLADVRDRIKKVLEAPAVTVLGN